MLLTSQENRSHYRDQIQAEQTSSLALRQPSHEALALSVLEMRATLQEDLLSLDPWRDLDSPAVSAGNFRDAEQMDEMIDMLKKKGRPLSSFHKGDTVRFSNKMSQGSYVLTEAPGEGFAAEFKPVATPGEILALGAFGGRYLNDCVDEFPAEWFWKALLLGRLAPDASAGGNVNINAFGVSSRLPLSEWRKAGWVPGGSKGKGNKAILSDAERNPDDRGWFQWYCRYWMGRRIPDLDTVQIQRWRAFARHAGAVRGACKAGDLTCRPRQRQALLHWSWPFWS